MEPHLVDDQTGGEAVVEGTRKDRTREIVTAGVGAAEPALSTSITVASRLALTPKATASHVAMRPVAANRLLTSFIVWPEPGLSPR